MTQTFWSPSALVHKALFLTASLEKLNKWDPGNVRLLINACVCFCSLSKNKIVMATLDWTQGGEDDGLYSSRSGSKRNASLLFDLIHGGT